MLRQADNLMYLATVGNSKYNLKLKITKIQIFMEVSKGMYITSYLSTSGIEEEVTIFINWTGCCQLDKSADWLFLLLCLLHCGNQLNEDDPLQY